MLIEDLMNITYVMNCYDVRGKYENDDSGF